MPSVTFQEVLAQVEQLSIEDQLRLLEDIASFVRRRIPLRTASGPAAQYKDFKEALLAMPDVGQDSDFERIREFPEELEL